jgi:hypothetical protein
MTVVFKEQDKTFTADQVLWFKKELIEAVVQQALISQTEALLDMTMDTSKPEEITRASVNETLRGAKDCTADFLDDILGDFVTAVKDRLVQAQYGAAVTGLKYDLAGDVTDIEVDVSVSFE